jgi:hypothetical protein
MVMRVPWASRPPRKMKIPRGWGAQAAASTARSARWGPRRLRPWVPKGLAGIFDRAEVVNLAPLKSRRLCKVDLAMPIYGRMVVDTLFTPPLS